MQAETRPGIFFRRHTDGLRNLMTSPESLAIKAAIYGGPGFCWWRGLAAFRQQILFPTRLSACLASGRFRCSPGSPQIVRALKRDRGQVYINRLITRPEQFCSWSPSSPTLLAPVLIVIMAPGYSRAYASLTVPSRSCVSREFSSTACATSWASAQCLRGVFGPTSWAPVLNNIIAIAGLVAFLILWGARGLQFLTSHPLSSWLLSDHSHFLEKWCRLWCSCFISMRRAGVSFSNFHFRGTSLAPLALRLVWTFLTLGVSQVNCSFNERDRFQLRITTQTEPRLYRWPGGVFGSLPNLHAAAVGHHCFSCSRNLYAIELRGCRRQ